MTIGSKNRSGKFTRKIQVTTNDAENHKVQLTCNAYVRVPFQVKPRMVNFGRVADTTEELTRRVEITKGDGGPLNLELEPVNSPNVTAELKEVVAGERYELEVAITSTPAWKNDRLRTNLRFKTGIEEKPYHDVTVYAQHAPAVAAYPSRLMVPADLPTARKFTIQVRWASGKAGKILNVSTTDPKLTAKQVDSTNVHRIEVEVPANYVAPPNPRPYVVIKTDDVREPLLRVPVFVTKSRASARAPQNAERLQAVGTPGRPIRHPVAANLRAKQPPQTTAKSDARPKDDSGEAEKATQGAENAENGAGSKAKSKAEKPAKAGDASAKESDK